MFLSDIAHVRAATRHDLLRVAHLAFKRFDTLSLHGAVQLVHFDDVYLRHGTKPSPDKIAAKVSDQHAVGRKMTRRWRNDDCRHPKLPRDQAGV